jgi:hypothetical protein
MDVLSNIVLDPKIEIDFLIESPSPLTAMVPFRVERVGVRVKNN